VLEDRFGLPLSTPSTVARDAYVAGIDSVISGVAGYRDHLGRALDADPAFALALVALARGQLMDGEVTVARQAAARARELATGASPRERSHVDALCLGIEGKPPQAMAAMLRHVQSWPRDAMVIAPATSVFGLFGFSGRLEHEEELYELLASLAPAWGEDWWFDTVFGFAACETGRLDEAWTRLERSLARHPLNAHAEHYRTHVLYERGDADAALSLLEAFLSGLDKQSLAHCHLSWHVALAALATGRCERAWEAYRSGVHPGGAWGPPLNVVTDAVSFLWRAELAGEAREARRWSEIRDHALKSFPVAGTAYADVHTLLACIVEDDLATLDRLLGEIRQRIADHRYPPGEVVLHLADGFAAYARGDWNASIAALERARPEAVRIGGSRAQRDLVEFTLLAALLKADRPEDAQALVHGLDGRRPMIGVAGYA